MIPEDAFVIVKIFFNQQHNIHDPSLAKSSKMYLTFHFSDGIIEVKLNKADDNDEASLTSTIF